MVSLAVVTGFSVMPAIAELTDYNPRPPADSETGGFGGFPQSYKDSTGLKLDLCLAESIDRPTPPNYCLTEPPDQTQPASVSKTDPALSNFPDEAFWWTAEAAAPTRTGNAQAILVLATEAAFPLGDIIDGDQVAFNRTRIRVLGGLRANVKYKITYPYGVKVLTATRKGNKPATINFTEDFGCAVTATTECNFADLLAPSGSRGRVKNPIGKPWLTWDNSLPTPPVGYIGDPNVDHKVTGSPFGTNFFKVEELAADGVTVIGQPIAFTDLFSVSGKVSQLIPSPTTP